MHTVMHIQVYQSCPDHYVGQGSRPHLWILGLHIILQWLGAVLCFPLPLL